LGRSAPALNNAPQNSSPSRLLLTMLANRRLLAALEALDEELSLPQVVGQQGQHHIAHDQRQQRPGHGQCQPAQHGAGNQQLAEQKKLPQL
jgi:hypothetical protein